VERNYQNFINEWEGEVLLDVPLAGHTTFKIGGPADLFLEVDSEAELIRAIKLSKKHKINWFLLGGGSNVLISDLGFRGLVIKNRSSSIELIGPNKIRAQSGVKLSQLARFTEANNLSGLEFIYSIPGTLGGGIKHNVRFRDILHFDKYSGTQEKNIYIGDFIDKVVVLKPDLSIATFDANFCNFRYEGSIFKTDLRFRSFIILSADFILVPAGAGEVKALMERYREWRFNRSIAGGLMAQPLDPYTSHRGRQPSLPSAGCIFLNLPNPDSHPSGRLIDLCGLKGVRIGDAQISEEHANYIVNLGKATANEVIRLIKLCKREVKKRFGIDLIEEIVYVGNFEEKNGLSD
jgi:UDP-N-acetylmuramate dehydrogenase